MPHKNKEASKEYFRQYHLKHKAKKNEASKKHYEENKEQYNNRSKEYWIENRKEIERVRDERLAKNKDFYAARERLRYRKIRADKYGLNHLELPEVLECELCSSTSRVAFDHDHTTGEFRGFLCVNCNLALGMAKDNPELLESMAKYLRDRS